MNSESLLIGYSLTKLCMLSTMACLKVLFMNGSSVEAMRTQITPIVCSTVTSFLSMWRKLPTVSLLWRLCNTIGLTKTHVALSLRSSNSVLLTSTSRLLSMHWLTEVTRSLSGRCKLMSSNALLEQSTSSRISLLSLEMWEEMELSTSFKSSVTLRTSSIRRSKELLISSTIASRESWCLLKNNYKPE